METSSDNIRTSEVQILEEIRDTTADGRAFYVAEVFLDGMEGFFGDRVTLKAFREINARRIAAEQERDTLKADLTDCEIERDLADKEATAQKEKAEAIDLKFQKEVQKNVNNTTVLNGYKKQANTGKIMTIVGGVGIGVGIAGVLYAVIVTQIP